jgi:hypothetical protein
MLGISATQYYDSNVYGELLVYGGSAYIASMRAANNAVIKFPDCDLIGPINPEGATGAYLEYSNARIHNSGVGFALTYGTGTTLVSDGLRVQACSFGVQPLGDRTLYDVQLNTCDLHIIHNVGPSSLRFINPDFTILRETAGGSNNLTSIEFRYGLKVTDSTGAAISGASVRITDATGSARFDTTTNATGNPTAFSTGTLQNSSYVASTRTERAAHMLVIRKRENVWAGTARSATVDFTNDVVPIAVDSLWTIVGYDGNTTGITVTDHGGSPVSWNGLSWGITVIADMTTNPALTPSLIYHYLKHHCSLTATFNGKSGLDWHQMLTGYDTTANGTYGATTKGVRVIDQNGDPLIGFIAMQSDSGVVYNPPVYSTGTVIGHTVGSRIQVYNETATSEVYNGIPGSTLTITYTEGVEFTIGDVVRVRIAYQNGTTANMEEEYTAVATASGWTVIDDVIADAIYIAYGVDGSTCTEFSWDGVNLQVDINDADNTTQIQRVGAWYQYFITTETGIRDLFQCIKWDKINEISVGATCPLQLDNTKVNPLKLTGGRIYREDGTTIIAPASGSIHIDFDPVYMVETATSGLTVDESQKLTNIDNATKLIPATL